MIKTIKTTTFMLLGSLLFSGCGAVDDAINDAVSGDVTADTIILKDRAIIIDNVNITACVAIKNVLVDVKGLNNAETLVTEIGVNCASYQKAEGALTDPNAQCVQDSLVNWLEVNKDLNIDFDAANGDKACVIGFDL